MSQTERNRHDRGVRAECRSLTTADMIAEACAKARIDCREHLDDLLEAQWALRNGWYDAAALICDDVAWSASDSAWRIRALCCEVRARLATLWPTLRHNRTRIAVAEEMEVAR